MIRPRTVVILLIGVMVGLVFSPVSILFQFQELEVSARQVLPPCTQHLELSPVPKSNNVSFPHLSSDMNLMGPPPKFPHDPCKLNPEGNLSAPSDPNIRHRQLMMELSPRKLLYIGVISSAKYLPTRAVGIYKTWGKEILPDMHFYSAPSDDPSLNYLPIITLPGVNDTQYPPQKKVYRTLKYMADHFLDKYDFFIRSDDDVYYRMEKLLKLVEGINPAQDIYMGCPGFGKDNDKDRLKLEKHEHYCMGGPGVIFSRSALRKLAPHLETCLQTVVVSWNEDVEIGRCVSKMLNLQCTWAWETRLLFWTDYEKVLPTSELYTSNAVKGTVSLHPIKDPRLMYRVHQYMQQIRLQYLMQKASRIQADIQSITSLLPSEMNPYHNHQWLWYDLGTNPQSRYEIAIWEYFNSTRLFLTYEHMPVVALPTSLMTGSNTALEVLLEVMNSVEGKQHPFVPPYQLVDGYSITDHSSGVQYNLHVSVHREDKEEAIEYMASVFLPLQGAGMATYREARQLLKTVVNIIVCIARTHDVTEFLRHYESVCLHSMTETHLHMIQFGTNPKVMEAVSRLKQLYPKAALSLYEMTNTPFSYSHGYDYVAEKLSDDSLMVLFDHNFYFTPDFLTHCRMLAVQGSQAFFPVAFSFYKPELVEQYAQRQPKTLISADTGFFLRYNYQVVALYRSDYNAIGGFGTTQGNSNDDVRFIDKVLDTNVYVLRALEPYLRRDYKPRSCKGLESNSYSVCMNSKADSIASKKILGALVASNNLMD